MRNQKEPEIGTTSTILPTVCQLLEGKTCRLVFSGILSFKNCNTVLVVACYVQPKPFTAQVRFLHHTGYNCCRNPSQPLSIFEPLQEEHLILMKLCDIVNFLLIEIAIL